MHHTNKVYDYIIIGAGISGIHLANMLRDQKKSVLILEKSRNIGGRIANRRFYKYHFALGLNSFQVHKKDLKNYALKGLNAKHLDYSCAHYFTNGDITNWSKSLIDLNLVRMSTQVEKFIKVDFGHKLIINNQNFLSKNIIITAPSAQSFELLRKSGLTLHELNQVQYSNDIFYYCRTQKTVELAGYQKISEDIKNGFYYSKFKALDWNEKARGDIKSENDSIIKPLESHAHKWRYSKVTQTINPRYQLHFKDQKIYLAGDYFFGNDLNAAIDSSNYLLKNL